MCFSCLQLHHFNFCTHEHFSGASFFLVLFNNFIHWRSFLTFHLIKFIIQSVMRLYKDFYNYLQICYNIKQCAIICYRAQMSSLSANIKQRRATPGATWYDRTLSRPGLPVSVYATTTAINTCKHLFDPHFTVCAVRH